MNKSAMGRRETILEWRFRVLGALGMLGLWLLVTPSHTVVIPDAEWTGQLPPSASLPELLVAFALTVLGMWLGHCVYAVAVRHERPWPFEPRVSRWRPARPWFFAATFIIVVGGQVVGRWVLDQDVIWSISGSPIIATYDPVRIAALLLGFLVVYWAVYELASLWERVRMRRRPLRQAVAG